MTIAQWLRAARVRLASSGSPDPAPDADGIACKALGVERSRLRMNGTLPMPPDALKRCENWLSQRERGEPLQYILGEAWFYGRRFLCDARALIPRQDTETLCEEALLRIPREASCEALDLCTGSGILAVTLALERPRMRVAGADLSEEALSLAKENAHALDADVEWLQGDLFSPLQGRRFDCIVCNPPYLTAGDMAALQREVRVEPQNALFGGEDGLEFYRRIARFAPAHLKGGGWLFLEIGSRQGKAVAELCAQAFPGADVGVINDINGLERVVWLRALPN